MTPIILIGGGGHCRSVIDVIESSGVHTIKGIVDKNLAEGTTFMGYPVIGGDDRIGDLVNTYRNFHICIGHLETNHRRKVLFEEIQLAGGLFPVITASSAYVSKHATLEEGTIVMHQAVVNANARIGKNCIINSGALVEHDTLIGDHCHVSTGAAVNGGCQVGNDSLIGSNATLIQGVRTAPSCLIAAGAVVTSDATITGMYAGVPAVLKTKKK